MNPDEIRQAFLNFFKQRGHQNVASDSLVPSGDPTLLFTSAGMVQFKKHFLGQSADKFTRAVSCQKCFRTSDIEQVGRTNRHLTFFEMLGNFSFGDYFKEQAIGWGWEFLTKEMRLPEEKLYATVYKDDDEAAALWKKILPESRIVRLGDDTNFWNMGPTGPCGPCSEILIDLGEKLACNKPGCGVGCSCDRYLEIWNLVFTQFDRQPDGSLKNLPRKNIDTGMGLERLAAAAGGHISLFDTGLFKPYIAQLCKLTGATVEEKKFELRMMADHARAVTFLIGDGILPSNEGRGYVLRRILRRALRQGRMLGINEPFLHKVTGTVIDTMKNAYPELAGRREHIASITKNEEEKFLETLEAGTKILDEIINRYRSSRQLPGAEVFKLYDTYGFPQDMTREIALEHGLTLDDAGFIAAQKEAQNKSRAAWAGSGEKDVTLYSALAGELGATVFEGYSETAIGAKVTAILKNGKRVTSLDAGEEGEALLDRTPFYAESGGQAGDRGKLVIREGSIMEKLSVDVTDTQKPVAGCIAHKVKVLRGTLSVGMELEATVDVKRRERIKRHHTATHILHRALRHVLGAHVTQAGSMVTPDYFRFDFTHPAALSPQELSAAEEIVNDAIRKDMEVCIELMNQDEARKKGAMALFGEKYGETVRAVSVLDTGGEKPFSMELCGGTHVGRTGNIGLFKIISESSVASGTRRIEAVAGEAADNYVRRMQDMINSVSSKLKTSFFELDSRVDRLVTQQKDMEKEIERLKFQLAAGETTDLLKNVREIGGIKLLAARLAEMDPANLRSLADNMQNRLGTAIVLLASAGKEKISFVVTVSEDLASKGYNAGKIAKSFAALIGGSGGGKTTFAQGGGKAPTNLDQALTHIGDVV